MIVRSDNPARSVEASAPEDGGVDETLRALGGEHADLLARALSVGTGGAGPDAERRSRGLAVARILRDLNLGHESIAAAIVHVCSGDRGIDVRQVRRELGAPVARLIDGAAKMALIHEHRLPGHAANRDQTQMERLKNLLLTMVEDVRVVLITLAERVVTMRRLRELPAERRATTARQSLDVYAPLASRLGIRQFKWELEDLAFRELEPETYASIARQLDARRVDRDRYIAKVVDTLSSALAQQGVRADVSGRAKHIYSIWRKMRKRDLGFEQVFDLRAVRVLVASVADCYSALGVVHTLWTHLPGEFDDYITKPKANRYQSLHTAVIGPSGKTVEVQIRTHDMHAHAELGVAAHWRYKEDRGGRRGDVEGKIAWLRQVLEWKDDGDGSWDLLDQLDAELLSDRVYAVTPRGEILDLPTGATPLDFAYHIHTDVGHRCRGAKVNGAMVPLAHALRSGDQVEIITTRGAAPSRDWLNANLGYLKTARARAKVRHWFRQLDYDRNLAEGQEIYARELKRLGVEDPDRSRLATRFNYKRFDDLLAGIGRGDVSGAQLANALQEFLPVRPDVPALRTRRRADAPGRGDVQISGVGNLLTQIANCCKPVPPEPIVGFITRGRGVSVHRRDCDNVLRMEGEERARLVDVAWGTSPSEAYPVSVTIDAYDRRGLLRDITALVANEDVNVAAIDSHVDEDAHTASIRLSVEVTDLAQLSRIMDRLAQLANVFDVRRGG